MNGPSNEAVRLTIAAAEWELLEKPHLVDGFNVRLAVFTVLSEGLNALERGCGLAARNVRVAYDHARDILIDSLIHSMKECPR
jgi:hypothetical protein